jgi:hypothetical protein
VQRGRNVGGWFLSPERQVAGPLLTGHNLRKTAMKCAPCARVEPSVRCRREEGMSEAQAAVVGELEDRGAHGLVDGADRTRRLDDVERRVGERSCDREQILHGRGEVV